MDMFTVKLNQDESIDVLADIVKEEDGVLSFYNKEKTFSYGGAGLSSILTTGVIERLVGKFDSFEYFYIAKGVGDDK